MGCRLDGVLCGWGDSPKGHNPQKRSACICWKISHAGFNESKEDLLKLPQTAAEDWKERVASSCTPLTD